MKFRLLMLLLFAPGLWAQSAPDLAAAPHYRKLLSNDQVRVFALTLRPLERTMARHDHNFLVIALQDCDVVIWPEGESDIINFHFRQGDVRFYNAGRALGIRNDRTTEYRNVTVEFLDPKVTNYGYQAYSGTWDYGPSSIAAPTDPHSQVREFNFSGGGQCERCPVALPRSFSPARETRRGTSGSGDRYRPQGR